MRPVIIFIVLVVIMLAGCGEKADPLEQNKLDNTFPDDAQDSLSDIVESDMPEVDSDYGTVSSEDSNGDGEDDTYILTFEKEEVAQGLFMAKEVRYDLEDEEMKGTITLEFSGSGTYDHVETIPKSFASHVEDIEFSVEPDEIIEEDPVVRWEITKTEQTLQQIKMNAAIEAGVQASAEGGRAFLQGRNPAEVFSNTLQSVAVGSVLEQMSDMSYLHALGRCGRIKTEGFSNPGDAFKDNYKRDLCIRDLMIKYPEKFTEDDCKNINLMITSMQLSCHAIATNRPDECIYTEDDVSDERAEKIEQDCRKTIFLSRANKCDPNDQKCINNAALFSKWEGSCELIKDEDDQRICHGTVYENEVYCKEISDESKRRTCCENAWYSDEKINACIEDEEEEAPLEEIPEEQEEQDEFRMGSGCPVSPPAEAKKVEAWYNNCQLLRYSMPDYSSVGPYYMWYDKEMTKPKSLECYNLEGKREGPQVYWDEDGFKTHEYTTNSEGEFTGTNRVWKNQQLVEESHYTDGKWDGTVKSWNDDGILLSVKNYAMGEETGEWKLYYSTNGALSEERTYDSNGRITDNVKYYSDGTKYYEKHGTMSDKGFTGWTLNMGSVCQWVDNEITECE